MARKRTIKAQFQYLIKIAAEKGGGHSKHIDKLNNATNDKLYSISRIEGLRDTAKSFSSWAAQNSNLKYVKDITAADWSDYVEHENRLDGWSDRTREEVESRIEKLAKLAAAAFNLPPLEWSIDIPLKNKSESYIIRDIAMTAEHLRMLELDLAESKRRINAYYGLMVTSKIGCRAAECVQIHSDDIIINKNDVKIKIHGKGGRIRYFDVFIDDDIEFFRNLKKEKQGEYITGGIKADSLNAAIRKSMERCGISEHYYKTNLHSLRKSVARRFYDLGIEFKEISRLLGHNRVDKKLRRVYLGF